MKNALPSPPVNAVATTFPPHDEFKWFPAQCGNEHEPFRDEFRLYGSWLARSCQRVSDENRGGTFLRSEQQTRRGNNEEEEGETGSAGLAHYLPHRLTGQKKNGSRIRVWTLGFQGFEHFVRVAIDAHLPKDRLELAFEINDERAALDPPVLSPVHILLFVHAVGL